MKVIQRGAMPDGTAIQIEDWSEDYPNLHMSCDTIGAYPIAQWTFTGSFAPKAGERFRASFQFDGESKAAEAFLALQDGKAELKDYKDQMHDRAKYAAAIGAER